jgi:cell division protein FtsB
MVVRTRARAILLPLAFYLVLGGASGYLVWAASKGQRGSEARAVYLTESKALQAQLTSLQADHVRWKRRVDAMRSESIDRDLLEEEAHSELDRVGKDEVAIFSSAKGDRR